MPLTTVSQGLLSTDAQYTGFKNRIINGAMVIDQRNAGAVVTSGGSYLVDRFESSIETDGAFTLQQVAEAPTGFVNSLKFTTTTADASLGASQYTSIRQKIEGLNVSDLAWGTASAATVTLSFWVRSSLTGTFGGVLKNSAQNRSYAYSYTISAANTWEQKTITIAGDTTGTWLTTNGIGINVIWGLGVGSSLSGTAGSWQASNLVSATGAVSVIGTLSATWQVTGVQLEKGSTATSFDYRPYGTELALCQRYFYREVGATGEYSYFAVGGCYNSSAGRLFKQYPVTMRAVPTYSAGSGGYIDGVGFNVASTLNLEYGTVNNARLGFTTASSFGAGQAVFLAQNTNANFSHSFNAEL